jgi:RNA-binding protein
VVEEVNRALSDHELIKLRLGRGCAVSSEQVSEQLARQLQAATVQVLGHVMVIFRQDADDPKIKVPDSVG